MATPSTRPSDNASDFLGVAGRANESGVHGEILEQTLEAYNPEVHEERDLNVIRRRLVYMMLFRVVVISLVLGATTVLAWLDETELLQQQSLVLYFLIGFTYLLTILYALRIRAANPRRLAFWQLTGDLMIATTLVHVTGGLQSAYTFFFPLAIIGAAVVGSRRGVVIVAVSAAALFVAVSLSGYFALLPSPQNMQSLPTDLSFVSLSRYLGLNLAAIIGVGTLATNLAGQLQRTSDRLESQRSVAADLITLHGDIVRSLTSGLITVDLDGNISTINDSGCDILGLTRSETLDTPLHTVAPSLHSLFASLQPEAEIRRSEATHVRPATGVESVLGVSLAPLYNHRDQVVGRIVNFQDLTEMKQMEQHVARAERLAVVGHLAAGIAHEIRNPLAAISGSVELLLSAPANDADSNTLTTIVGREIDRLNGLITELLDYTNPRPLNKTSIDVTSLVDETLQVFRQDPRNAHLEIQGVNVHRAIHAQIDPEKLRQALWNLFANAADAATTGGGHVYTDVRYKENGIAIEVRDDGPGIPPEELKNIFDPFFTTKAKGNGLGLATVHSIVRDHDGEISVTSDDNGTRFVVEIPNKTESTTNS